MEQLTIRCVSHKRSTVAARSNKPLLRERGYNVTDDIIVSPLMSVNKTFL